MTTTLDASRTTPNPLQDLTGIRGPIITRADLGYDRARAVYNGAVDRHPLAVVRCADVADVLACVGTPANAGCRSRSAAAAITAEDSGSATRSGHRPRRAAEHLGRPGGRHRPGRRRLHLGRCRPRHRRVRDGNAVGFRVHDRRRWTRPRRWSRLPQPTLRTHRRQPGLGRRRARRRPFVTASAESHPDLFWALRGGGGNFGVVTSFTFRCHPVGEQGVIIGGPVMYDIADVEDLFRWYRELLPSLPETSTAGSASPHSVRPAVPGAFVGRRSSASSSGPTPGRTPRPTRCWPRSATSADPLLDGMAPMPFSVLQTAFDPLLPTGLQWYWKADFFDRDHRRGHCCPSPVRRDHPDSAVRDAHVPDQWGRRPGAGGRYGVRVPQWRLDGRDCRDRR